MDNFIIYCRKSTESEERQVLSIESQIKELQELVKRLNLPSPKILTESKSAKSPGRPVFNDLMKRVCRGEVKGILCWKLDRLARNPIDGSALVWALDQGKLQEIVTPQSSFQNNSNDKFLMQIEFGMAKKYVDDLSDNVKRGNRAKLEKGWLPGKTPLGYLNDPLERTVIPDPNRFPVVRKMWDLLLKGTRPTEILQTATEEWGLRTRTKRSDGRPLSISALYALFGSPFYHGLIERKEGVFQGKHTPMITEDEYWKAQEILGRKGRPRPKRHSFAFTGLIRCGECGRMVTAEEKDNRYGHHYVYYRCTKKLNRCGQRYINEKDLEAQILGYLERIHVPESLLELALDYLEKESQQDKEAHETQRRLRGRSLQTCQRKLANLNQMRMKDLIDDEEYQKEKKELLREKLALERAVNTESDPGLVATEMAKEVLTFAHQAVERFKKGSVEDKRTILRDVGSNLSLKDKKLLFQATKPFQILAEGLPIVYGPSGRLEPQEHGSIGGRNGALAMDIPVWWGLVEDVRTFFTNLACDDFPHNHSVEKQRGRNKEG